ncbi:MAG TPA: Ig-like domain-containing protein, partial [Opitutaceae bacterium]|nr:Ig-like domain-containing protein [Opitutaceae bacterium]
PAYTWDNVVIRGGGFVSGILFHPTSRHLIYARTDVGGVYRWAQSTSTWTPLNDDLGMDDAQLTGVLSFAVDPTDDRRLYLACGQYLPSWARTGAILRSTDRGATWTRTELPIKLGGNSDGRGTGERLQVDPNKPSVLLLGTNQNGLWKSTDSGVTWSQVTAFTPTGVTFVLFDGRSGSTGNASQTIYVGVDSGTSTLYRTTDGGFTWTPVPGAPTGLIPTHADFDANGMLYLSYADNVGPNGMTSGAIWKYDTGAAVWTNISPRTPTSTDTFGWGAVSVGKTAPGVLVATTNCRWGAGDEIWRSTDGGATWTNLNPLDSYDAGTTPWILFHGTAANYRPHWMADVDIDPFDANRVLFVTGSGIWGTDNAFGGAPVWTFRNNGLEETVPLDLASPPSGTLLLSALGDIGGFRHDSLDASQPEANFFNPVNSTNTGLDFAQSAPANVVRTNYGITRGCYSVDGGRTWRNFATCPATATAANGGPGKIAINTDGSRIVWNPDNSASYYSTNFGNTWTVCAGVPSGSFTPVADRVNANKFYVYDSNAGRLYVSTNGGQSFTAAASVPAYGNALRAVFGLEGNLWLPAWSRGLYRSTNSGTTFTAVSSVQEAYRVGFGKAAAGQTHPAIFLWGKVGGVVGLHRSDDTGATWTRINDDAHQYGWINAITGDPHLHGRIYVATGGRGIVYGTSPDSLSEPTVSITSPAGGASFTAGTTIVIDATAADADGTVTSVAFYRGTTLIGTDTTAPYSVSWTNPTAGTYSLTAVATDDDGLTTTSAAVSITVNEASTPPPSQPPSSGGGGGGALSLWSVIVLAALGGARLRNRRH